MGVILGAAAVSPLVGLLIASVVGTIFGFAVCMKLIDYYDRQPGRQLGWDAMTRKDREIFVSGYARGWADHRSGVSYSPEVAEAGMKVAK